jgi:6-phosphogluconate dehydrogenase (decarboxylating)
MASKTEYALAAALSAIGAIGATNSIDRVLDDIQPQVGGKVYVDCANGPYIHKDQILLNKDERLVLRGEHGGLMGILDPSIVLIGGGDGNTKLHDGLTTRLRDSDTPPDGVEITRGFRAVSGSIEYVIYISPGPNETDRIDLQMSC